MVKEQSDREDFEGKLDHHKLALQKKSRNIINYLKPTSEDAKNPENTSKNKDYVWWLI